MSRVVQTGNHTHSAYHWLESREWAEVNSSNVAAIRWDGSRLVVRFNNNRVYAYSVTRDIAARMFNTTSMGKFVWFLRRSQFPVSLVS
jgi:hypothetical protein